MKTQKLEVTLNEIKRMQELAGVRPLSEQREDVGKYNTVAKIVRKLGKSPSPEELAEFIVNNYYDVTEVEPNEKDRWRKEDAYNKISDLVAYFKYDTDEWESVWEDVSGVKWWT